MRRERPGMVWEWSTWKSSMVDVGVFLMRKATPPSVGFSEKDVKINQVLAMEPKAKTKESWDPCISCSIITSTGARNRWRWAILDFWRV